MDREQRLQNFQDGKLGCYSLKAIIPLLIFLWPIGAFLLIKRILITKDFPKLRKNAIITLILVILFITIGVLSMYWADRDGKINAEKFEALKSYMSVKDYENASPLIEYLFNRGGSDDRVAQLFDYEMEYYGAINDGEGVAKSIIHYYDNLHDDEQIAFTIKVEDKLIALKDSVSSENKKKITNILDQLEEVRLEKSKKLAKEEKEKAETEAKAAKIAEEKTKADVEAKAKLDAEAKTKATNSNETQVSSIVNYDIVNTTFAYDFAGANQFYNALTNIQKNDYDKVIFGKKVTWVGIVLEVTGNGITMLDKNGVGSCNVYVSEGNKQYLPYINKGNTVSATGTLTKRSFLGYWVINEATIN